MLETSADLVQLSKARLDICESVTEVLADLQGFQGWALVTPSVESGDGKDEAVGDLRRSRADELTDRMKTHPKGSC